MAVHIYLHRDAVVARAHPQFTAGYKSGGTSPNPHKPGSEEHKQFGAGVEAAERVAAKRAEESTRPAVSPGSGKLASAAKSASGTAQKWHSLTRQNQSGVDGRRR